MDASLKLYLTTENQLRAMVAVGNMLEGAFKATGQKKTLTELGVRMQALAMTNNYFLAVNVKAERIPYLSEL